MNKMNPPKISIIVPVHNAGQYFEKCITSLINQTLRDIEIILVLDCPTDGSDKIAEYFAGKDNRIKLIHNEENLHTGLSRNKGMEIAQGEYIGFHDHDDYCEPKMYELLYEKAEQENLDVVRCNFSCIYENNCEEYKYPNKSANLSDKKWIYENVCNDGISCVIWNHIYKTAFLKKHGIQFLDSRTICSEDSVFFLEVYNRTSSLGIVSDYLYSHVFHSSNTGKVYDYRSIQSRIAFFEELYSFLKRNDIEKDQCQNYLSTNIARSLYSGSRQALKILPLKKALAAIQTIKKNKLIIECINSLYKRENRSTLYTLKPTIVTFFFILRLF